MDLREIDIFLKNLTPSLGAEANFIEQIEHAFENCQLKRPAYGIELQSLHVSILLYLP